MKRIFRGLFLLEIFLFLAGLGSLSAAETARRYTSRVPSRAETDKSPAIEDQVRPLIPEPASSLYRLGPEDLLKISVWKDETLTAETLVRPDGNISFPLVGDVMAAGMTVDEVREEISRRLVPFIPDPTVSVLTLKINSYKIYVVGKVNRPGEYLVGHYSDVMQALSLAGGLTPFASENKIKILRRESGKEAAYLFQYGDVKKGKELEQNLILKPGDVVVVP